MTSLPPCVPEAFQYIGRSTTKGPLLDCTAMRDLIARVAIAPMEHMLLHNRHHVHRGTAMPHHLLCEGVDRADPIGDRHIDRLGIGGRVLDGQPLVIAQIGVAFRKAVVAHGSRSHLSEHIGAAHRLHRASIARVAVAKVHLALHRNLRARGGDLSGDRLRGACARAVGIDIPDHLAERIDRHREHFGGASVILQRDGHSRWLVGRIEIGQHEVLLEASAGVAFGKEPVVGELLHPNHIRRPRDAASVAASDAAEVGGSLAHHRLAGGQHHRDASRQVR